MVDQIPQPIPSPILPPQPNTATPQMGTTPQPVTTPQQIPQYPFQQAPIQPAPVRPQQTANITKPTSKISMKTVLIGCGILFMIVV